jgi:hypothetical protein
VVPGRHDKTRWFRAQCLRTIATVRFQASLVCRAAPAPPGALVSCVPDGSRRPMYFRPTHNGLKRQAAEHVWSGRSFRCSRRRLRAEMWKQRRSVSPAPTKEAPWRTALRAPGSRAERAI